MMMGDVPFYSQNNRNFRNMLLRSRTADRTLEQNLSLLKLWYPADMCHAAAVESQRFPNLFVSTNRPTRDGFN